MALLFVFAAGVQWNDPDAVLWMLLYGAAALLSLAAGAGRFYPVATGIALAVYLGGFLYLLPALRGASPGAFASFHMKTAADEETREAVGLALCAAWTATLWLRGRRARQRSPQ